LAPEERHHVYKMLTLMVIAHLDEALEVSGAFEGSLDVCARKGIGFSIGPFELGDFRPRRGP
jgi:hypothetical protein